MMCKLFRAGQGILKSCAAINKERPLKSTISEVFGPSGATRTPGLLNPNQARYHLRYTRIFGCHDYSTKLMRFKVLFCLWSFMWSNLFFAPVLPEGKIPQVLVSQRVPPFRLWEPGIRRLRSQSKRATNCATPGYSVFPA